MSHNLRFAKSFNAGGALAANSIAKVGANDYGVLPAAAATDKLLGITTEIPATSGERVDVALLGVADLKLGGTVTRGDLITSDASSNGVTSAPAAGVNHRIVGVAQVSGVSGDLIPVLLSGTSLQGQGATIMARREIDDALTALLRAWLLHSDANSDAPVPMLPEHKLAQLPPIIHFTQLRKAHQVPYASTR